MNATGYSIVFALIVAIAYRTASDKNRPVWGVLLAFSVISSLLNVILWDNIDHPLEHYWFASIEVAKIILIMRLAPTRTGDYMCTLLFLSGFTNYLLYLDLIKGSNLVYDRYEIIIAAIAIGQLIPFVDALGGKISEAARRCLSIFRSRALGNSSSIDMGFCNQEAQAVKESRKGR